jgi:hypothetical protein
MNLKITTPSGSGIRSGALAHLYLDGVDVSRFVRRVVLTVDSEQPITAEVTVFVSAVDVDTRVHDLVVIKEVAA